MPVDAAGAATAAHAPVITPQVEVAETSAGTVASIPVDAAGISTEMFARAALTAKTLTTTLTSTSMMRSS